MRYTCPERGLEGDAPDRQPWGWTSTDLLVKESLIALSTFVSPCGSAGKESTCKVGDLGSIPGVGRAPGEGKGYPLQYSGLENSWTV